MRRSVSLSLAALVALLALAPDRAEAGRRPFLWTWDTEVMPERGVELEQWVWEREAPGKDFTAVWWAPVIGLTDQLELALPVEWFWWEQSGASHLQTYGLDLRLRLDSPDPAEAGKFVPLLRVGVKRLVLFREKAQLEGNLVLGYDPIERLHLVLDLGASAGSDGEDVLGTLGAGASWQVRRGVRVGAELFGVLPAKESETAKAWLMAGPNAGFTFGRAWFTVGVLAGLTEHAPVVMPRLIWAVSF